MTEKTKIQMLQRLLETFFPTASEKLTSFALAESSKGRMAETLQKSFLSKASEKLMDYGLETVNKIKEVKTILETLESNLKLLAAKTRDINEQIKNEELSGKRKRRGEVENWLKKVQKIESELVGIQNGVQEEGFASHLFDNNRLVKLDARICELLEESCHFDDIVFDARQPEGKPRLTAQLFGKAFKKNAEAIWQWLVIDKIKSIGICGMGGVGKTSLAKHVYNRFLSETEYRVYWISVSQQFTVNKLQDDIAKVVGLDLSDEDNEDERAGRLNQALSQKDFVLVLDDVWSDIDLEKLGDPLGVEGCRLIVTTRSLTECHRIDCQKIIKVEKLQMEESWTLFRETLGEKTKITSEVAEIAKCMVKECDGLPLGIIVIAKSMKGVTDIHEWKNVYNEIRGSAMELDYMKDRVFQVLKYSFDRLHTKLQHCLLYCSFYPEDHEINKDELIRNFISDELMDVKKSWEKKLDLGYTMLNKLVNLCLLEDIRCVNGSVERVKMHNLVREMALKIGRDNMGFKVFAGLGLKEIPNEEEWTEVKKLSLMRNHIRVIPTGMTLYCSKLVTLLLNENPVESIPESFFEHLSSIRILDLSVTSIRELPDSLSHLGSLYTLRLSRCYYLVCVPYLGKLKALRELDLSWTSINKMPEGMENLINLKILLFICTVNLKLQPGDLSLVSPHLLHLKLPSEIEVPVQDIQQFKCLDRFVGRFKDIHDFNQFIKSDTAMVISTFYYYVGSMSGGVQDGDSFMDTNTVSMFKCIFRREGENWVIILPKTIQKLEIKKCECLSSCLLDNFKSPSFLKNLTISGCDEIQGILSINEANFPEFPYPSIESICLTRLPNFKGLINCEVGGVPTPLSPQVSTVFSHLTQLKIDECNMVKTLRLPLQCLQIIESIKVERCAEIEELIELVEVGDDEEISESALSLPKLKRLSMFGLPKLKNICNVIIDCKSIDYIRISRCPRVKKLPFFLPPSSNKQLNYSPSPAYKKMKVDRESWESLEWDTDPTHKPAPLPYVGYEYQGWHIELMD